MQNGTYWAVALLVGALAAAVAVSGMPAWLAFAAGALLALAGLLLARYPEPAPDAPPAPEVSDPVVGAAPSAHAAGFELIDRLPAPLLVVSPVGRLVHANAAAKATLPRLEPGQHFAHIIRAPAFVEALTRTLEDGEERSFSFGFYDGSDRHFDARASVAGGGWLGPEARVIVQIEDRTKSHRAEQLRADFIANASHELRTPLASIIGYIETLQNHARDDAEARERFLGVMEREAQRMRRLVEDLMSLSRIEMNEHVRPVERVSLNRIAIDCASIFMPLARQEGVALRIELETGEGEVLGDRDQLAQVFTNLIDNAMKYCGAGGTITVRAAGESPAHPNRVGVAVDDTGPGIPRDKIPRLTERFYRVNVSQSRNRGGTGLGLAIVKHILNRHKGRLEIHSVEGEGSTFTVWLPRAEADQAAEREAREPAAPIRRQA
jgi:two-component system, OmpR family, phosphate regulon sensor histidine kinase PhoR